MRYAIVTVKCCELLLFYKTWYNIWCKVTITIGTQAYFLSQFKDITLFTMTFLAESYHASNLLLGHQERSCRSWFNALQYHENTVGSCL